MQSYVWQESRFFQIKSPSYGAGVNIRQRVDQRGQAWTDRILPIEIQTHLSISLH